MGRFVQGRRICCNSSEQLCGFNKLTRHLHVDGGSPQAPITGEYLCNVSNIPALNRRTLQHPADVTDVWVYYQNVRGLRTKIDDMFLAACESDYDVIMMTEMGLDDCIQSQQLFGTGFNVFRCDRSICNSNKRRFGGVLIAVAQQHKSCLVETTCARHLEQICVSAVIGGKRYLLCAVYIPPDKSQDTAIINAHVDSVGELHSKTSMGDVMLVCGDYNQPRLFWTNSTNLNNDCSVLTPAASALTDGMDFLNLCQSNLVCNHLGRTLDLVFCNADMELRIEEATVPLLAVDLHHPPLAFALPSLAYKNTRTVSSVNEPRPLNYRRIDFTALLDFLSSVNWQQILNTPDVDKMVTAFCKVLIDWFGTNVPVFKNRVSPAWSTKVLRKLKREKNAKQRLLRRLRTPETKRAFRKSSDAYRKLNSALYKTYVLRVQTNLRRNPQSFWNFVNTKRKCSNIPSNVYLNDTAANTTSDACDLFARYFKTVFATTTATDEDAFCAAAEVPENLIDSSPFQVTIEMFLAAARSLKNSFSPGLDGIPSVVYRRCSLALAEPLCMIFNRSLSLGKFPDVWKNSLMTPVFKTGDKRNVKNYRGVTNLSAASKLFEIIVNKVILNQAKKYISPDQHGFMPGRSVSTNLLEFTSTCITQLERRSQVDVVYTDLKAAFDRIDHSILLSKLSRLGMSDDLVRWMRTYLVGRTIRIRVGSSMSEPFVNLSGVPQGSNLGPLLFIIFFNDVALLLGCGCKLIYADDLKLFLAIRSITDCIALQRLLDLFIKWCRINWLTVSVPKCVVMTFHRIQTPIVFNYYIEGVYLNRVEQVKDLGVILDPKLSFDLHRTSVIKQANRQLGFISKLSRDFTDVHCLKSLYCSLVRPILESAVLVWTPHQLSWTLRIERVQKRFIRLALRNLPWRDPDNLPPYTDRCRLLDLDTLERRRKIQQATFVAKLINGELDAPKLLSRLEFRVPQRSTRCLTSLHQRFHRTTYGNNEPMSSMIRTFTAAEDVFEFGEPARIFSNRVKRSSVL